MSGVSLRWKLAAESGASGAGTGCEETDDHAGPLATLAFPVSKGETRILPEERPLAHFQRNEAALVHVEIPSDLVRYPDRDFLAEGAPVKPLACR